MHHKYIPQSSFFFSSGPALRCLLLHVVKNSFCWCSYLSVHAKLPFMMFLQTHTLLWYPHHAVVVPTVAPHACPLSPCATHLLNRRPPACMWLWTVCHRPALLPPVTMLRTLSLRLGPAPVPEQAPPPLSLAPGKGPAPPCPPLSTAPLVGAVWRIRDKETWTDGKKGPGEDRKKRERRTDKETDAQTYKPDSKIIVSKVSQTGEQDTCELSIQPQMSGTQQKPGAAATGQTVKQQWRGPVWDLLCDPVSKLENTSFLLWTLKWDKNISSKVQDSVQNCTELMAKRLLYFTLLLYTLL